MNEKKKILFIGQTPPPFHGQAFVIEKLWNHDFKDVELVRVRLDFSYELSDIGKFQLGKIYNLVQVILKSALLILTNRIDAIFYPPSGHKIVPVIRDIIILVFLRLFRKKLIFHFHILGLNSFYHSSSAILKALMRMAYNNPDFCICLSENNVDDIRLLNAKKIIIIQNGIKDKYIEFQDSNRGIGDIINVLYVGNLYKEKGVSVLLDATKILFDSRLIFNLNLIGGFKDEKYKEEVQNHELYDNPKVNFLGIQTGAAKWKEFAKADIFCFPTIGKESCSVVTIEAMSFALPIVITDPRMAFDRMVIDEYNGFIVEKSNPMLLAKKLREIISNRELQQIMGVNSRKLFLDKFHESIFIRNFEKLFGSI